MEKTGIFYGSTTGNTESVAEIIKQEIGTDQVELINVENATASDLDAYSNLIFGTSTWGLGDLQDDFQEFISVLSEVDLSGKVVALYGLGDSSSYADTFVDGMGEIYETIEGSGCEVVGSVAPDGYDFEDSKAFVNGEFIGLPLDEENDGDKHEERVAAWVESFRSKLK